VNAMPEKHTTVREGKRLLWYTEGLWQKAEKLTPFEIEVASIKELDENCWFGSTPPTLREVLLHHERIQKADLDYPIILNHDGSLMDGGHRLCKAVLQGRTRIRAVQFPTMPDPDEICDL
jgi:hypothetical protein